MSVISRLKAIQIIGQKKAFYRQRIPEPTCARKENANLSKILIFASSVKFLILQIFKTASTFCMIPEILFIFKFSVVRIMNYENFHCVFFKLNIFRYMDCHLYPFLNTNTGYLILFFIRIQPREKREMFKNFEGLYNRFFVLKKEAAIICVCCT